MPVGRKKALTTLATKKGHRTGHVFKGTPGHRCGAESEEGAGRSSAKSRASPKVAADEPLGVCRDVISSLGGHFGPLSGGEKFSLVCLGGLNHDLRVIKRRGFG